MTLTVIFWIILAFLLGSIPVGFIVGKLKGVDVREHGSGNIGATNVGRTLGKGAGIFTLIADILKGVLAAWLGRFASPGEDALALGAILGFTAIAGHCFSPFLQFRGGKGVATALGVFLALAPIATLFGLLGFVIVFKLTRIVSLSSITAVVIVPLCIGLGADGEYHRLVLVLCIATSVLITCRHHDNLKRLFAGTEQQLGKRA